MVNGIRFATVEELFRDPSRWAKGAYARGKSGHTILNLHGDEQAVQWCLIGGIAEVYPHVDICPLVIKALQAKVDLYGVHPLTLIQWNDAPQTTHAMLMAVVRKAGL